MQTLQKKISVRRKITKRDDFRFQVPARRDRKHSWKQHAKSDSYFYRVLSRIQHMAEMNHGFVYESKKSLIAHSSHWRRGDAPSVRTVEKILAFLREKGFISPKVKGRTQTTRGRNIVDGFYLAPLEMCSKVVDGMWVLYPAYDKETLKQRFQPWQTPEYDPTNPDPSDLEDESEDTAQNLVVTHTIRTLDAPVTHTIRTLDAYDSQNLPSKFALSDALGDAVGNSQSTEKQNTYQDSNGDSVGCGFRDTVIRDSGRS